MTAFKPVNKSATATPTFCGPPPGRSSRARRAASSHAASSVGSGGTGAPSLRALQFVLQFLGDVNLFHGRVHEGVLASGDASFTVPDHAQVQDGKGIAYVRPHDLELHAEILGQQPGEIERRTRLPHRERATAPQRAVLCTWLLEMYLDRLNTLHAPARAQGGAACHDAT